MEFLGSIFEIGKNMWEATAQWFGYFNNLDANMRNLKRKIEDLSHKEEDINAQLSSEEQRPGKRRKKEVEAWLSYVSKEKDEVQRLEQRVAGERNLVSRARLGKEVVEKIAVVAELQEKGNLGKFSNALVIDAPPSPTRGLFIPTTRFCGETTSARNMEKVWACLMDEEVRRIGIVGMGGVGKTTLMQHINNRLSNETCDFDKVIWVTVSKAFDIRKIQNEIAKALDVDISKYKDQTIRASKLYKKFSQMKSYVLILDDLWEAFPLEKVGIPKPSSSNGCKLVLTTRLSEVCRKMGCRSIKVELLTEQEALNLFMSKVANQTVLAPEVEEIATKVAKECACLPLAIVTIAGSMRGVTDIREWRNALNELSSLTKEIRDDEQEIFERLKFSYSRLKDEKLQRCFLYCALYPEDEGIDREQLISYWIAEGLIAEMNSREAMFDEGHTVLNKLENSCLLESPWGGEEVRMHDLIRDMALMITATSPRFMVQAGEGLERVCYKDWPEDVERVSLMFNKIQEIQVLPDGLPSCCWLTTLLLSNNSQLVDIPDSFFRHMPSLEVLDLSCTGIKSLPESISHLDNLRALLLEYCEELKYVPSLEKLKALIELNLSGCISIEQVPQGIEELVNLMNLDLSDIRNQQQSFLPSKICRLSRLQCLKIGRTGVQMTAKEVLGLRQLEVLEAEFNNVQELFAFFQSPQFRRLKKYSLSVGSSFQPDRLEINECHDLIRDKNKMGKCVSITDTQLFGSGGVDDQLPVLPSNMESLKINKCHDLFSLSDIQSLRRDARDLIKCVIKDCNGIKSICSLSSISDDYSQIPLRRLDHLCLDTLCNFRVLFDGVVPPYSISFNLKKLVLCECPSIKSIFPVTTLLFQNFANLETLEVRDCEQVEDIIGGRGGGVENSSWGEGHHHHQDDSTIITHRSLRHLNLQNLPILKSIYKGKMVCESLEIISVTACPMLRRLPLSLYMDIGDQASAAAPPPAPALQRIIGDEDWCWESLVCIDHQASAALPPPALKSIGGDEGWWESLEWDDPHTKSTLDPFLRPTFQRREMIQMISREEFLSRQTWREECNR